MSNGVSDAVMKLNLTWTKLVLSVVVLAMTIVGSSYAAVSSAVSSVAKRAADEAVREHSQQVREDLSPEGFARRHELEAALLISNSQYEEIMRRLDSIERDLRYLREQSD